MEDAELETALSDLIGNSDFIDIHNSRARFNLFEAVGATRAELKHSNFLAFLLSPARTHGLSTAPLQLLLRALLTQIVPERRPIRPLEVAIGDISDALVFREVDNIDLLIDIPSLNLVFLIENKVGTTAADGQLERYKRIVEKKYPSRQKLFVYLTPEGSDPEHPDYVPFSYTELASVIESLTRGRNQTYVPEVALILNHYVEMLRRNVVSDERLKALAQKIYERYADAIDFIVNCKPESTSLLPVAQKLVQTNADLEEDHHSTNILRFFPKAWAAIPALANCPADRWTKTGRNVLFEIKSFKSEGEYSDRILLSLILGPSEAALRKFLFDSARANKTVFPRVASAIGQYWTTLYSRELLSEAAAEGMAESEKETTIISNWNDFTSRELASISKAMIEIASKAPVAP